MIITECYDGFVAEIQSEKDFLAFLNAFYGNDGLKPSAPEDFEDFDENSLDI